MDTVFRDARDDAFDQRLSVSSVAKFSVEISELAKALVALGCPAEKSAEMAAQLDKRARQLAEQKGRTYEEALQALAESDAPGLGGAKRFMIYD